MIREDDRTPSSKHLRARGLLEPEVPRLARELGRPVGIITRTSHYESCIVSGTDYNLPASSASLQGARA
jgi:hypothetical protein